MNYHAILIVVDDNNNEITRAVYEEKQQMVMPNTNMIVHDFYIGGLRVPECKEVSQRVY